MFASNIAHSKSEINFRLVDACYG